MNLPPKFNRTEAVLAKDSSGKTIKTDMYGWAYVVDVKKFPDKDFVVLWLRLPGTYDPEDVYKIQAPTNWLFEVSQESPV